MVLTRATAILLGASVAAFGLALMRWGGYLVQRLNALYAQLPGRFQYPLWWHRLIGGFFMSFGLLVAFLGGVFGH